MDGWRKGKLGFFVFVFFVQRNSESDSWVTDSVSNGFLLILNSADSLTEMIQPFIFLLNIFYL